MGSGNIAATAIVIIRTLIPFSILRYPLGGAILGIVGDIIDVMLLEKFGQGFFGGETYHNFDKLFDTWYLFFEFIIVHRWSNMLARRTGKTLFLWRFAGFAIFEYTGFRPAFFLAPNIFEHFYLTWTVITKYFKKFELTIKRLVIILLIVGLPKLAQEAIMHWLYPNQTWVFLRDHLFWWLYN